VYFIDEQDVAGSEAGEETHEVARFLEHRPR
jgi:hypothetical protein